MMDKIMDLSQKIIELNVSKISIKNSQPVPKILTKTEPKQNNQKNTSNEDGDKFSLAAGSMSVDDKKAEHKLDTTRSENLTLEDILNKFNMIGSPILEELGLQHLANDLLANFSKLYSGAGC